MRLEQPLRHVCACMHRWCGARRTMSRDWERAVGDGKREKLALLDERRWMVVTGARYGGELAPVPCVPITTVKGKERREG